MDCISAEIGLLENGTRTWFSSYYGIDRFFRPSLPSSNGSSRSIELTPQPTSQPGCSANQENDELLTNLDTIAAAGGSTAPFMIDTGDTAATQLALDAAIQSIRSRSISCEVAIPEHPLGGQFDKDKINVSVTENGNATPLGYDAGCETDSGWHYDDETSPKVIELCDSSCSSIQASPGAQLNVDFLCMPRPDTVK